MYYEALCDLPDSHTLNMIIVSSDLQQDTCPFSSDALREMALVSPLCPTVVRVSNSRGLRKPQPSEK